jgi:hypothetical protein
LFDAIALSSNAGLLLRFLDFNHHAFNHIALRRMPCVSIRVLRMAELTRLGGPTFFEQQYGNQQPAQQQHGDDHHHPYRQRQPQYQPRKQALKKSAGLTASEHLLPILGLLAEKIRCHVATTPVFYTCLVSGLADAAWAGITILARRLATPAVIIR